MYSIRLSKSAEKTLLRIPQKKQAKIIEIIEDFQKDPFVGIALKGKLEGTYKYVVWPYRMLFGIDKKSKTVTIKVISHRQNAYK